MTIGVIFLIGMVLFWVLFIVALAGKEKQGKEMEKTLKKMEQTIDREPLPGGGGVYQIRVRDIRTILDAKAVEKVLTQFPDISVEQVSAEGVFTVHYDGYPQLDLLDRLKAAVEQEGFVVDEIM